MILPLVKFSTVREDSNTVPPEGWCVFGKHALGSRRSLGATLEKISKHDVAFSVKLLRRVGHLVH